MTVRQLATVKRSFTIPEPHLRPARTGACSFPSASNGGLRGRHEATPSRAVSPDANTPDPARIRILSVDNHPLFREGIAKIIKEEPDITLISQASTGQEAIQRYREHRPDITLMEIWLPDLGGIDALLAIRAEFPRARVVILTSCDHDVEVQRALAAGASGYLLKDTHPRELLQEIRKVHAGRKAIQPQLAAKLAEHIGENDLTAREGEVLALVARGNRNRDIGERLCISEETVKAHLKHIREKLGARDRTEATAIAVRRGIIRL